MNVSCRGCGAAGRQGVPSGSTVAKHCAPGWHPLLTYEGAIFYFCPECSAKLHEAASKIDDIVRNDSLYFASLLKMGNGA